MVELSELFTLTRFPPGFMFALMVLYFPVGVFLIVCRVLIALHTYLIVCLLPKSEARRQTVRVMLGVLGIHVIVDEDKSNKQTPAKIIVSNYTSVLDHIIVDVLISNIVPYEGGVPAIFQWVLGYKDLGAVEGKEKFKDNIKSYCQGSNLPVMLHPEEIPTNNTVGLLKFNSLAFELELPVQPVAIQVSRLSFPCALTTVDSPRWTDVLWCFFTPITVYKLKLLPMEEKEATESAEDFAEKVRGHIAEALSLKKTDYAAADRAEYVKELRTPKPKPQEVSKQTTSNGSSLLGNMDTEMKRMVQQVKDVLPQVPVSAIKQDLEKTKDVDVTISNILEERVTYSAEEPTSQSGDTAAPQVDTPQIQNNSLLFKSEAFPRSSGDRHLSLKERKQQMLATARQRYKEKHNLP